ncbi:chymotrypsinogen A-like [Oppia nitens]|uniref:chymotrypsinogen A-like n=1 Tax=Oppia nitens TaxID=1686743 RepID=UPI0023D9BDC6|nr:chymotrypsinogen A-like [Oppia nitens]
MFICLTCLANGDKLLSKNCGQSRAKSETIKSLIVGGVDVAPGEFPWQVILSYQFPWGSADNCGATIINENWVLTAAHCTVEMPDKDKYNIRLGVRNRTAHETSEVNVRPVKIVTNNYNPSKISNDIALLKLNESLDFNGKHKHLAPICLPDSSITIKDCVATGIGLNKTYKQPVIMQKVSEPIVADNICHNLYSDVYNQTQQLCAGGHGSTCTGDSGGPLQCQTNDGKWYQFGITSYGAPGCDETDFGVYTKVLSFTNWIQQVIDNN